MNVSKYISGFRRGLARLSLPPVHLLPQVGMMCGMTVPSSRTGTQQPTSTGFKQIDWYNMLENLCDTITNQIKSWNYTHLLEPVSEFYQLVVSLTDHPAQLLRASFRMFSIYPCECIWIIHHEDTNCIGCKLSSPALLNQKYQTSFIWHSFWFTTELAARQQGLALRATRQVDTQTAIFFLHLQLLFCCGTAKNFCLSLSEPFAK